MKIKKVISEKHYKAGYVVKEELIDGKEFGTKDTIMKSAYNPNGDYIGNSKNAYSLCVYRGIAPELASKTHGCCSIGYSKKHRKWYGWSHRAMFGFKKGSTCKKGDCHYIPSNRKDFLEDVNMFWDDKKSHEWTVSRNIRRGGKIVIMTEWKYSDAVQNIKLRGTISGMITEYPKKFGKGEWTAQSMADAKQMAKDFASGVN